MHRKEMISAIISHKDNLREDELKHHGILGQKWGVRRYQNADGSYTAEGRERYGIGDSKKSSESKEGGMFSKKVSPPGHKPNLDKEIKLDSEEGKEVIERIKQLRENDKKIISRNEAIENLYEKSRYDSNVKCDYSVVAESLGINEDSVKLCEKFEKEANESGNEIKEMYADYVKEANTWAAASGLVRADGVPEASNGKEIAESIIFNVCEDGDQGSANSAALYALSKGITEKSYSTLQRYNNAVDEYRNEVTSRINAVDDINKDSRSMARQMSLDEFENNQIINFRYDFKSSAEGRSSINWLTNGNPVRAAEAAEESNLTPRTAQKWGITKEKIQEAKRIPDLVVRGSKAKNLTISFWEVMADAVENLGYSDTPRDQISDSQWEKVGVEMSKILKEKYSDFE